MIRALLIAALAGPACLAAGPAPFKRPDAIVWGASVAESEARLEGACERRRTRRIDPPFLADVRRLQMQIDCDGFAFEGGGRHMEFVIRDDRLVMVWLMHTAAEDAVIERRMTEAYGPGVAAGATYLVFPKARAALRRDKHEVLFYGPEMDGEARSWFAAAAGGTWPPG